MFALIKLSFDLEMEIYKHEISIYKLFNILGFILFMEVISKKLTCFKIFILKLFLDLSVQRNALSWNGLV